MAWGARATMGAARQALTARDVTGDRGKTEPARDLLGEAYGKFTEGFTTADLREAKALLEDLSGGTSSTA